MVRNIYEDEQFPTYVVIMKRLKTKIRKMKIKYTTFMGDTKEAELKRVEVPGDRMLLHTTPDEKVEAIRKEGLRVGMPAVKNMTDVDALWLTIPSETPVVGDLFRYYDDWSIVVVDPSGLDVWLDPFAQEDASNNGNNKHVMVMEDIPAKAIHKIIKA